MKQVSIREPEFDDEIPFLTAMQYSRSLHSPWVTPPLTKQEFRDYVQRFQQPDQKSFLVCAAYGEIAGVINVSEIVRGHFQSAYLGFYSVSDYAGKGYMSAGLKLVLQKVFIDLSLHRVEANIQPGNIPSISLVRANGFRKEGYSPRYLKINGEWRDHERWAMTIEDWEQLSRVDS
jgi:RimJ/RimL family protein N-acetyltransferase